MRRFLALLLLLAPCLLRAQVQVAPLTLPRAQFLSGTGVPLAAGCVTFNATGTSTPQAIYADSSGLFQLANPLTLDSAGEADVWMTNVGYDITAYTGVFNTPCSTSLGSQVWQVKNKNPFSIINQGSNFIVASGTSDPAGSQGELAYRSDIPCFRGFTTIWDCFVTLTATQTLTNKQLASPSFSGTATGLAAQAPVLTSPSIAGGTLGSVTVATGNPTNFEAIGNDATTGTTLNTLTKLKVNGSLTSAVISAITDTGGVEGIAVGGAGATGNVVIQRSGQTSCVFDGGVTATDYVQISSTVAGNCHDTGSATFPLTGGQVIGRSLVTVGGAATYQIELFGPEIRTPGVSTAINLTAQGANITSTPILTPTANGFYRFNCYVVVTQAATTSSTSPNCNAIYTDADSSVSETILITTNSSANTVGAITAPQAQANFFAKSGSAISYSTTGYATSGATSMQYALHIRLEGPF